MADEADSYQPRPEWPGPHNVTINQYTQPSPFRGRAVAVWGVLGTSYYVFVLNPNLPMTRLLDAISMWGGQSKRSVVRDESLVDADKLPSEVKEYLANNEVPAWEVSSTVISADNLCRLLNRL